MKRWFDVTNDAMGDGNLNLLTDCDQLCHVIHIIYLDRADMERIAVPPYFVHRVEDSACDFGDLAKLHCDVTGQPNPTVEWYREGLDGPLCEFSGKYAVIQKCGHVILMINDVTREDIGSYTCKIYNDVGVTSSTGRLFFAPNYKTRVEAKKTRQKLIIEESLKIVERRESPDISLSLRHAGPDNRNTVAIAFAVPEHCSTTRMTVSSARKKKNLDKTLKPVSTSNSTESLDVELSSGSGVKIYDVPMHDDVISRLEWIETGSKSDSAHRGNGSISVGKLQEASSLHGMVEDDVISQPSVDESVEKENIQARSRTEDLVINRESNGVVKSSEITDEDIQEVSEQNKYFDSFFETHCNKTFLNFPERFIDNEKSDFDDTGVCDDLYLIVNQPEAEATPRDPIEDDKISPVAVESNGFEICSKTPSLTCVVSPPRSGILPSSDGRNKKLGTNQKFEDCYVIGEALGSGRFGKVFVVENKTSRKKFAGKQCRCRGANQRRDIEREVAIMRQLDHPKLLRVYDVFFGHHNVTLVLELVTGGELFDRIADDSFNMTEKAAASYVRQICEGISHMHSLQILHLDIKPENIICLTPDLLERIKIIDFGLSRHYSPETPLKVMFGTPEFVAPEVVNYDPLGKGTDAWSIGVITYVLLSGLSPFMGDSVEETLANVTAGDVDFDDECFDDVTDDAKNFISSLLVPKVKDRPTCEECLSHSWLQQTPRFSTYKTLCVAVFNMKKYVIRRKWAATQKLLLRNLQTEEDFFDRLERKNESSDDVAHSDSSQHGSSEGFGSILSYGSTSSLPYYSAREDGFTSEGTIDYFSPLEDFNYVSTDDFFSPASDLDPDKINTPMDCQPFYKHFATSMDDDLFIPRPIRSEADYDVIAPFQITAFDSTSSISDQESDEVITPVPEPYFEDVMPPFFEKRLNDVIISTFGDAVTFACVITGSPAPMVEWRKEDSLLDGGEGGGARVASLRVAENTYRHVITLNDVTDDDVGEYTVAASNQFGHMTSTAYLRSSEQVRRPCFDEIIEDVAIKPNDDVTFSVVIKASPSTEVTWLKDNFELIGKNLKKGGEYPRYHLTISSVTIHDVGVYSCKLRNRLGEAECKAELTINEAIQSQARFRELYSIIKPIHEGSRGCVKLVQSNSSKQKFAAKYVKRREEEFVQKEIDILRRLDHPNIVTFEKAFTTPNYVIMVTEACGLELINYLLAEPNLTEVKISSFISQLCQALAYLHRHDVIHLSIRPESLLISRQNKLKLSNFDDAILIGDDEALCDWGVPDYVAPEIVMSLPVTSFTDMWSVGIVTYIFCTGVSPFAGVTDQQTLLNIKSGSWNEILQPLLSNRFNDFINQLLCFDPSKRMTSPAACGHAWLNMSRDEHQPITTKKLKLFRSKQAWQRSLISVKSALIRRPISSLLRGEFHSTSVGVPRLHSSNSTITDSEEDQIVGETTKETANQQQPPAKLPQPSTTEERRKKFAHSRSHSGSMERPLTMQNPSVVKELRDVRNPDESPLKRDSGSLRTKMWKQKLGSDGKKVGVIGGRLGNARFISFSNTQLLPIHQQHGRVELPVGWYHLRLEFDSRLGRVHLTHIQVSFEDEWEKIPRFSDVTNSPQNSAATRNSPTSSKPRYSSPLTKNACPTHDAKNKKRLGNFRWLRHQDDDVHTSSSDDVTEENWPNSMWKEQRRLWGRRHSSDAMNSREKVPKKGILKKGASLPERTTASLKEECTPPQRPKLKKLIKSSSTDKPYQDFDSSPTTTRRHKQMTRGVSADSALLRPKFWTSGLRGPLLERLGTNTIDYGATSRRSPLLMRRQNKEF